VDDLVDGLIRLMRAPDPTTGPVNLGNPAEFTIRELAEMVARLTGSRAGFVHRPLPQDDPLQRCPDIALARDLLGWRPTVALEAGLRRTIGWFTAELGQPHAPRQTAAA
jgi:UDP-glucuronate decarboxylase